MLQLNNLRNNTPYALSQLAVKNFKALHLVEDCLALDDRRKQTQLEIEALQQQLNATAEKIGLYLKQAKADQAAELKKTLAETKETVTKLKEKLNQIETKLHDTLVLLPNLPSPQVPQGQLPEHNVIVKQTPLNEEAYNHCTPHWDIATQYQLISFELGAKITGSGFPVYTGDGAKLQRALVQYFLDFNTVAGYTEMNPPFLVNTDSAFATGQLPDKEGQMYCATEDNFFLIPTAEVPLTNIYRNELIKKETLPIKLTAFSPCFRREAGSYGKDVKGLNRLHQFEKVEIVQIVEPAKSYTALQDMVDHVEKLLQSLELDYRILLLCGGDMSFASAQTFDFEVYSGGQKRWLEVSSVSNFETFQTYRMKCRVKEAGGKNYHPHSLNGSALALPRIMASLLEKNTNQHGIAIPACLQPYFGRTHIKGL